MDQRNRRESSDIACRRRHRRRCADYCPRSQSKRGDNMNLLRRIVLSLAAAVLGALALPALAQDPAWPGKPVRIVVPFPPGGAIDAMIRALAQIGRASCRERVCQYVLDPVGAVS